jgi:hypothetical protein
VSQIRSEGSGLTKDGRLVKDVSFCAGHHGEAKQRQARERHRLLHSGVQMRAHLRKPSQWRTHVSCKLYYVVV